MESKVGTIGQFKDGILAQTVNDVALVFFLASDGSVTALEDRCSHADIPLSDGEFDTASGTITCPAHGAEFCVKSGAPRCMPAVTAVQTYPVRVEGDEVWVTTTP